MKRARLGRVGLLAAAWVWASAAAADVWPEPPAAPIPAAAGPETVDLRQRARDDSIRRVFAELFARGAMPPPPSEARPRLVVWLARLLEDGDPGTLERVGIEGDPAEWHTADSLGELPLVAAFSLREAGRLDRALAWLERGRGAEDDLAYRRLLAIEILDAAGDSGEAMRRAEALRRERATEEWTMPAARRLLAGLEEAGRSEDLLRESLAMRRTLGRGADETAARFRALRALDRPAAARAVGDSLIASYPGTRTARVEAIRRFRESPDHAARTQGRLLFEVFVRHRLFEVADSLLDRLEGADSLRVVRLEGLLSARRPGDVLADSVPIGGDRSATLRARATLVRARAARNLGLWDAMEEAYAAGTEIGPQTRRTALAEWGREAESERKEDAADSIYSRLARIPGEEAEGRFRRGISRFAAGRYPEALADMESVAEPSLRTAAAFWRFRILEQLGDSVRAREALSAAAGGDGYYASRSRAELRARRRGDGSVWEDLARLPSGGGDSAAIVAAIGCGGEPPGMPRARRLIRLRRFGKADWASREQEILERRMGVEGRAEQLLCMGLPDLAVRVAVGRGLRDRRLRYPRAYAETVVREARACSIDAALVWAVARRESLFDPGAVSTAGARGFLQLMDATAGETARRHGLTAGPLERAETNIALGVHHMRDLMALRAGPLPSVLAAYNAGMAKTREWIERFPDPDLFIERIGWRETREYVRHVLDAWWSYREYTGAEGGVRP